MKTPDKYLIDKPEPEAVKPSNAKSYSLTPGNCKECTLEFQCKGNHENIQDFMGKLGFNRCRNGFCYKVV